MAVRRALSPTPMDAREQTVTSLCEQAVKRLAERLRDGEITCMLRVGEVLRHAAHAGALRVIYEIPRDLGGIVWRAADRGATQLVADVKADPDYIAADDAIRSEVAVPVKVEERVVGALNAESVSRVLADGDAHLVEEEAERLGRELLPFFAE